MGLDDLAVYRQLPWDQNGVVCNDANDCYIPAPQVDKEQKIVTKSDANTVGTDNDKTTIEDVSTNDSPGTSTEHDDKLIDPIEKNNQ